LICLAYVAACLVAGFSFVVGVEVIEPGSLSQSSKLGTFLLGTTFAKLIGMFAFLPALLIIVIAEAMSLRQSMFFVLVSAVLGGMLSLVLFRNPELNFLFCGVGALAGLTYWAIAGRQAGSQRKD
jgi:hypothetical protein